MAQKNDDQLICALPQKLGEIDLWQKRNCSLSQTFALKLYNLGFIFIGILLVAQNGSIEKYVKKSVKFIRICVLICKNGAVNILKAKPLYFYKLYCFAIKAGVTSSVIIN